MKVRKFIFFFFVVLSYIPVFAQVDTAWVRSYNGFHIEADVANAIAVDKDGNVYVTGWSRGPRLDDYATIKYSPNGNTLWVSRYDGPTGESDIARAIVVDDSGYVYVTGNSFDILTDHDYATIKYVPNGDTVWVRRYNGPGNNLDVAYALAVDNSGNVYVTGSSYGVGGFPEYATVKYASNGDALWTRRYTGLGGEGSAYALAVDDSGNVYVTGESRGVGTSLDYATIKYSPDGDTVWVRRYDGTGIDFHLDAARDLAVDKQRNVYVTGISWGDGTEYDYATIKYGSNGDIDWVRRYNGPINGSDDATTIALDDSGNVYVTGFSDGGETFLDYLTIKYAPNGDTSWVKRFSEFDVLPCDVPGPCNGTDRPSAIAIDADGNVYVTGTGIGYPGGADYATIKYLSNGGVQWTTFYEGKETNYDNYAHALAVDEKGNFYVTGFTESSTGWDYATIKYVQFTCIAKPGDANADGNVNLSDIIYKVNYVFKGDSAPSPVCSGDDNGDGKINILDIIYDVNYIFKGGPVPLKSQECCL